MVDGIGVTVHAGSGNHVRHVLIDGALVLEDGRPTRIDPAAIIAEAQVVADRLWRGSALYLPR
jgi:5-methylthioadenosine/S-adenosylhomocysteine deaminase